MPLEDWHKEVRKARNSFDNNSFSECQKELDHIVKQESLHPYLNRDALTTNRALLHYHQGSPGNPNKLASQLISVITQNRSSNKLSILYAKYTLAVLYFQFHHFSRCKAL